MNKDRMMRKLGLALAVWGVMGLGKVAAQRISFDKTTVNAGTTMWKRPVTAVFKFTNKDKNPLVVKEVDAGCGCMKPEWPSKALQRGESGEIRVTYDAQMLGHFDRYIDVYTNAGAKPVRVRMKALVSTGKAKTVEDLFPYSIGDILLSTNNVDFTDVSAGDSTKVEIEILNNSKEVYTPMLMHLPSYITATYSPEMLARGRRGKIELTLHSANLPDFGLNQTSIYLAKFSGDKVGTENEIAVSAVKLPDLHYTEGYAKKPEFNISTTELNLGKLGKKKTLTGQVKLSNKGNGVLKLSKIQAFNQAITVSLGKTELQPGESVTMKIAVDTKFLGVSKARPRVLIITNDAKRPKEVVNVNFER